MLSEGGKPVANLSGDAVVVQDLLIESASVHHQGSKGESSLMIASKNGDVNVVKSLLEHNAEVYLQDINGISSLK